MMTTFLQHPTLYRRSLLMFAIALIALIVAIGFRFIRPTAPVATPPKPISQGDEEWIAQMERRLRADPDDANAYAQLGLGLLQQVREQGDVNLYGRAGKAFAAALQRDPQQVDALMGQGILALALHDFHGALDWAEQTWAINPFRAAILGIQVDAQVELGQYAEAVATLQQMIDLRPDLHSYSRVSYLRELHGDVEGAIEAMQQAINSTSPGSEDWRWTLTHLGHLHFNRGALDEAAAIYQEVLAQQADYPYALAGLARVVTAEGDSAAAIAQYQAIVERLPLPEFVIALGELYEATGDLTAAQAQYDLVAIMQQLNVAAGMNVDLEMALFNASHGQDPAKVVTEARAAYAARPTIYAADALAWALYQAGDYDEAWSYSQESRRLGTQDAMLYFHAGMIAQQRGEVEMAHTLLQQALSINPYFSPLYGAVAQQQLVNSH